MRPVSHAPSAAHFFQILQLCSAASPSAFPFQSAHSGGSGSLPTATPGDRIGEVSVRGQSGRRRRRPDWLPRLSRCSGDVGGDDVSGVPVQAGTRAVIAAQCGGIRALRSIPGRLEHGGVVNLVGSGAQSSLDLDEISRTGRCDLSNRGLTAFPLGILELSGLEVLDLTNNHLTALPAQIAELVDLRELRIGWNQIAVLSSSAQSAGRPRPGPRHRA
jgi:Leucine-rich repeat (LRR) protein